MASFDELLAGVQHACRTEHLGSRQIAALAESCGPEEVARLLKELDGLDDAAVEGDAGDLQDEFWRLRMAYSEVLAEVGAIAVHPLCAALSSPNPQTRAFVARTLGRIRAPQTFEPLADQLEKEDDDSAAMFIIEAIGELRDPRAVAILVPHLEPRSEVNRGWVLRMAARALGTVGGDAVVAALARVLAAERDWFGRLGAVEGLSKIRDLSARAALRQATHDEDLRVREAAREALR